MIQRQSPFATTEIQNAKRPHYGSDLPDSEAVLFRQPYGNGTWIMMSVHVNLVYLFIFLVSYETSHRSFTFWNQIKLPLPAAIMSLRPFCRLLSLSRTNINPSSTTRTATIVNAINTSRRLLNTSSIRMATQGKSELGQAISDVSKQEGGTFKGTVSSSPSY